MHRPPNDTHVTKFIMGVPFMEFLLIEFVSSFSSLGFYHLQKCYKRLHAELEYVTTNIYIAAIFLFSF